VKKLTTMMVVVFGSLLWAIRTARAEVLIRDHRDRKSKTEGCADGGVTGHLDHDFLLRVDRHSQRLKPKGKTSTTGPQPRRFPDPR
jgi:hypothetical protein